MLRSSATKSCDDTEVPGEVAGDGWDVEDASEHPVSVQARAKAMTRPAGVTVVVPRRDRWKRAGGVEHRRPALRHCHPRPRSVSRRRSPTIRRTLDIAPPAPCP